MKRVLLILLLIVPILAEPLCAQDCNSLFRRATVEYRRQSIASVQSAIKIYEAARRCYKSRNNWEAVQRCDERVAACYSALDRFGVGATTGYPSTGMTGAEPYSNFISFSVSKKSLDFSPKGGKDTIVITGNAVWSVPAQKSWFTLRQVDDELIVTAEENNSASPRSETFAIKYGTNYQQQISISQEGIEPTLNLPEPRIKFAADASWERKVTVTSNVEWEIVDAPHWCTAVKKDNRLVLTPEVNTEDEPRSGYIIITAGNKRGTITISQESERLVVSPSEYTFSRKGGKADFRVQYSGAAAASFDVFCDHSDWCSVSKPDNNRITVQCLPNKKNDSRTANIFVRMKNREYAMTITQEGKN